LLRKQVWVSAGYFNQDLGKVGVCLKLYHEPISLRLAILIAGIRWHQEAAIKTGRGSYAAPGDLTWPDADAIYRLRHLLT